MTRIFWFYRCYPWEIKIFLYNHLCQVIPIFVVISVFIVYIYYISPYFYPLVEMAGNKAGIFLITTNMPPSIYTITMIRWVRNTIKFHGMGKITLGICLGNKSIFDVSRIK